MSKQESEDLIERIKQTKRKQQERIRNMTPPCPLDNLPGSYYQSEGSPAGRVSLQYRCQQGDIFGWDPASDSSYLISANTQGKTPREAK